MAESTLLQRHRAGKRFPCKGLSPEQKFWQRVAVGEPDACWHWKGSHFDSGYGRLPKSWFGENMAHRVSYQLRVGEIPVGLVIDHLCRNRRCVNPAHLEPVTDGVNVLRGISPSAKNARKTHCKNGHELTEGNLYFSFGGKHCRQCALDSGRRRRPRKSLRENGIIGAKNVNAKLNPEKVTQILVEAAGGGTFASIARKFSVSEPVISGIVKGKHWRHVARPEFRG